MAREDFIERKLSALPTTLVPNVHYFIEGVAPDGTLISTHYLTSKEGILHTVSGLPSVDKVGDLTTLTAPIPQTDAVAGLNYLNGLVVDLATGQTQQDVLITQLSTQQDTNTQIIANLANQQSLNVQSIGLNTQEITANEQAIIANTQAVTALTNDLANIIDDNSTALDKTLSAAKIIELVEAAEPDEYDFVGNDITPNIQF